MLGKLHVQGGMSLIELLVGIAIIVMLFTFAAPNFSTWMQNTQIRTAAEVLQNGLTLARSEAVSLNSTVRFQLTTTLDAGCALSTSGTNWVVSLDNPEGACGTHPWDPAVATPTLPRIIQARSGAEGSRNALVAAGQSVVVFNGLGRQSPAVPGGGVNTVAINITNPIGGGCATDTPAGPMRCLRVVVFPNGQVLMCDPKFPSTDPQGCPP